MHRPSWLSTRPVRLPRSCPWRRLHRQTLHIERLEDRTLLSFLAPANYRTGGPSISLAVADLNGDGVPDLVTGNSTGTVSVLLGNGDGSFQEPRDYIVSGGSVLSVAVGDFTGNGNLDLVTVNDRTDPDPGDMSLLLGNGDGTFRPAIHFHPGIGPYRVATGDLNRDGNLDLVVSFSGNGGGFQGSVAVLLGNGDGTFRAGWTYDTGYLSFPIPAVGDFNGDGNLDLAVASGSNTPNASLRVFTGNGDGTFQDPQTNALGSNPNALAVGDLNGDGLPDLVVANGTVSVFLGNGDGSFQAAQSYDAGPQLAAVALGDVNGDNHLDVVAANDGAGTLSVLLGNGDGSLQPPQAYAVGLQPSAVAAVDLTGSGILDLVATNSYSGYGVSVRLGNGDGTFPNLPTYDTGLATASAPVTGDFNGDGIPDIALAGGGMVSVLLGNADGTFQAPLISTYTGAGPVTSLAVGDVNGDGSLDLIVETQGLPPRTLGGVNVLLGNGDGTFRSGFYAPNYAAADFAFVALGDLNGDNRLDLVVSHLDSANTVSVLLGNGDGSFQAPQDYAVGASPGQVAVADLNRDSHPDIVTANQSSSLGGTLSILLGNGDGTFQAPQTITVPVRAGGLAVGDLNGDGTPDLVLSHVVDSVDFGGVTVLLGNGDGTFQAPVDYFTGNFINSLAIADFNQDGRPDLAVGVGGAIAPLGVSVLLGNGDGTFQSTAASYGSGASVGAVADFTGDGFPDVVTTVPTSPSMTVLINAADWPAPSVGHAGAGRPTHSTGERPLGSLRGAADAGRFGRLRSGQRGPGAAGGLVLPLGPTGGHRPGGWYAGFRHGQSRRPVGGPRVGPPAVRRQGHQRPRPVGLGPARRDLALGAPPMTETNVELSWHTLNPNGALMLNGRL